MRIGVAVVVLAACARPVRAQTPAPEVLGPDSGSDTPELPLHVHAPAPVTVPATVRLRECGGSQANGTPPIDTTPGAYAAPAVNGPAVPWNEFAIEPIGALRDPPPIVHDLIEPAFKKLQTAAEPERTLGIAAAAAAFGYQLEAVEVRTTTANVTATFKLKELPIVRKVQIAIKGRSVAEQLTTALLDEDVRRRMQIKVGSYLPVGADEHRCKLLEEHTRVEDYLHDEGYYDATVDVTEPSEASGVLVEVVIDLGASYQAGKIDILHPAGDLSVSDAAIKDVFRHCGIKAVLCFGTARFRRAQFQDDLIEVANLFHKKGFPSVRVTSDYTPTGSFDRRTHLVNFKITIDQRRRLEVEFDGIDFDDAGISNDDLRAQLTFDVAGSADDVEAATSARALALYLQKRGHFEARVTWTRERVAVSGGAGFDRLRFRIDLGPTREVLDVFFEGVHAIDEDVLRGLVYTKANRLSGTLFGTNTAANSEQLEADVERIAEAYRQAGYRDARVEVSVATRPEALDDAALTAALVSADHGDGLYVQFAVNEGTPTLLTRVELAIDGDPALCDPLIAQLTELLGDAKAVKRVTAPGVACAADIANLKFKEAAMQTTGEALRSWLWNRGRSRANVDYRWEVDGPHRVIARYQIPAHRACSRSARSSSAATSRRTPR